MKRRANNEGTLYFNEKTKRWVGQVTLPTGKRKTTYGKTQKEVKAWLQEQREAIKDEVWIESEATTVGEFLDRYIEDVAMHKLRPKTIDSYQSMIRLHLKPELGKLRLTQLRAENLQQLYSQKLNEGLSKRTVQYAHAILHKALEHAVKWGLVARNVSDLADPPRPTRKALDPLTEEQVKRLFEVLEGDRLKTLYVVAIGSGMREGELLGLRWSDIELEPGVIHVAQAVQWLKGKGLVITLPKTKNAMRSIKLPEFARLSLLDHRKRFPVSPSGLVFATSHNTPFSPRNLLRHYHEMLEKAGIPRMRFHDLRHTTASLLLKANVHPKIVQAILGHSTITLTLDTYSHLLPGAQDEAAEKMNKLLG